MNVIDVLKERGFVENCTHEKELFDYLNQKEVKCYIGFDPTASSLHIGSLVPIMSLAHMQRNGHEPIALVGGGTGLVGDPSGKTEMRKILTREVVDENVIFLKKQLSRFIDFNEDKALLLNNADWLTKIEYIPFLRDIGRHFSVNRMIKAESYKMRLDSEDGLSFIEFNYMLLQAYDFLYLFDQYGCALQMGGSDQWGNIIAGIDLIRKMRQKTAFGITFPLITTSSGAKMGKTAQGAVWLDPQRTSPYEYYQYWVNTDDRDIMRFLSLYTFLPMDDIQSVKDLKDADLNSAKAVLAFETTQLVHGRQEAIKAYQTSMQMFGSKAVPKEILSSSTIPREQFDNVETSSPQSFLQKEDLIKGIPVVDLYLKSKLARSKSDVRRLILQGGVYINSERVSSHEYIVTDKDIVDGEILLRVGKKKYHKLKI